MSDQSYDRVRQQIKNLGLKHKGGGSYEKGGKFFGRVTKQKGQYVLKKAGETKSKEKFPGSKSFDQNDKKAVDKVMNMDPDKKGYDGDKTYKNMMTTFDKVIKKDDKQGQALLQKVKDKWNKTGSLGGADKNDKKIFPGDTEVSKLTSYIDKAGSGEDETGPETDVKDEPKSIDKVEKKTFEVTIRIPYENMESGAGQDTEDPDDQEEQPDDVEIFKKIKAADEEEAQARAEVEADEAYDKLKKRNKYDYHEPDYDMMEIEVDQISESYERKIMAKENINKFVNSLEKGDAKQAGDDLKNALADKVSSALDDAKTDVARSAFTGQQGADAPEANVFSGNDISAETPEAQ
tara:strand:- start:939 stop:1985 length:1047 start_codon:yes stop_codon:yes gene_type:complete